MKTFFALAGLFILASACAQPYSLDWYTIAGGGGRSTNGQFALSGTIGQHDAAGPMSGGNFSVTGGFWALISITQVTGAPTLYIRHSGSGVTVFWQNVPGWSLQQNNNLANASGWSPNGSWTTSNGTNYLNLSSPTASLFFRLRKD